MALLPSTCATRPADNSQIVSEQSTPDTPVQLLAPNQKVPPFNDMARLFDVGIPASEYDAIRELYFYTFVAPELDKKYSVSATWEEFRRRTERPSTSTTRTGLTSEGARHLVGWFAERNHFTVGSSKDDVLRVQGTPDEITESMWRYGSSRVFFSKDRVARWDIFPLSPGSVARHGMLSWVFLHGSWISAAPGQAVLRVRAIRGDQYRTG
jgi:hypothetical protein